MADFTQSKSTLLAHQLFTHATDTTIEGTAVSVASALQCLINIWHAIVEATANTNPGTFRVFGSFDSSGDAAWFHILDIDAGVLTGVTEALTATEPIGETALAVVDEADFVAKDLIYVEDAGTLADSEWHTVDTVVVNTSVNIMLGLAVAKDSSDVLWTNAEHFQVSLDCAGLSRIRVDFSHSGATGANVHIKAEVLIATDIE